MSTATRTAGGWTLREGVLVATLSLTSFGAALNGQFFAPVLPQVAVDLEVAPAAVGQLVTISAVASAALSLVAGPLSDYYGRRPTLLAGLGLTALAAIGSAFSPSYGALLVVRLFAGLGGALLGPSGIAAVADNFPPERQPQAMGWVVGATAGAIVLGWPAISLIAAAASWRVAFVALAGLLFLVALLTRLALPGQRTGGTGSVVAQLRRYRLVVADRAVVLGVLASGFGASAWFGLTTYLGGFFQMGLGLSVTDAAGIFSLVGVAYFLASVAGGILGARAGVRRAAIASGLVTTAALVLLGPAGAWRSNGGSPLEAAGTAPLMVAAVGLVIVLAGLRAIGLTNISSLIMALRPAERGTVSALNSLTFSLGITGGAGLGGLALALGGFPALMLALAAMAIVSVSLLGMLRPHG